MKATIIGFDVKQYSDSKNTTEMESKREILRTVIQTACASFPKIKTSFNSSGTPDTGDGCFIILDSGNFEEVVNFLFLIQKELSLQKELRVRAAVHRGSVKETETINKLAKTWVGEGINHAARFLDAQPLKDLLEMNPACNFVFGISQDFCNEFKEELQTPELISDFSEYDFITKTFIGKINLYIKNISNKPMQKSFINNPALKDDFIQELNKVEFVYPDKNISNSIDTFFIYPYLTFKEKEKNYEGKIDAQDLLHNFIKEPKKIHISGEEQTGKTTLVKKYFEDLYRSNLFIPVLIQCKKEQKKALLNLISEKFIEQYNEKYSTDFYKRIVLIFDDFHYWDKKQQKKIIEGLKNSEINKSIIVTDNIFSESLDNINLLKDYSSYKIIPFGYEKRLDLINKWIDVVDESNENYQAIDELNSYVDKTLIKGLLPYTPFYVLTVLLAKKEYGQNPTDEVTSKAHCYQILVYIQLKHMGINDNQINSYLNLLGYIAYYLYINQREYLSEEDFKKLIGNYKKEFVLAGDVNMILNTFIKSPIFTNNNSFKQFGFSSEYSYYYFVGKYMADYYAKDSTVKKRVVAFIDNLSEKKNYFISIFIVHHLKEEDFFDDICNKTAKLYSNCSEAKLTKEEVLYIEDGYKQLEELVIANIDRSIENRRLEAKQKDIESDNEQEETASVNASLKEIQQAIRLTELLGQIIKNHGEIKKQRIEKYYITGMNAYRRICNYFNQNFKKYQNDFVDYVKSHFKEQSTISHKDIITRAYKIFALLNFINISATVFRATDALGAKHLVDEIIEPVFLDEKNPLVFCIYLHSVLWYKKEVPFDLIKQEIKELPETMKYLVRALICDYTDKHKVTYKDKQKLSSILMLPIKDLEYDMAK